MPSPDDKPRREERDRGGNGNGFGPESSSDVIDPARVASCLHELKLMGERQAAALREGVTNPAEFGFIAATLRHVITGIELREGGNPGASLGALAMARYTAEGAVKYQKDLPGDEGEHLEITGHIGDFVHMLIGAIDAVALKDDYSEAKRWVNDALTFVVDRRS